MRWETKWSFDGKLYQEYSYRELSKSDNWFSSYSRKCWDVCFWDTVNIVYILAGASFASAAYVYCVCSTLCVLFLRRHSPASEKVGVRVSCVALDED